MYLLHLLLLIATQGAQTPPLPVTVGEYANLKRLHEIQVSPDGGSVAFTVTQADLKADEYQTALYVWQIDRRRTAVPPSSRSINAPRWSPAGAWLSFLAASEATDSPSAARRQVWAAQPLTGGEPVQVSRLPGGVIDYDWAPDGAVFALTVNQASGAREIWSIEVPDGTAAHVWGGDPGIRELAVSPDGRSIVYSTNGTGASGDLNYDLRVLDLQSRRTRRLTARPGPEVAPVWSADSRTIAFRAPHNPRHPRSHTELFSVAASGGSPRSLTDAFDRTVIEHAWPPGGDLLFTAAVGTYTHLFAVRGNGAIAQLTSGNYNYGAFDAAPVGTAIYAVRGSATEGHELYSLSGTRIEQLTQLNAHVATWRPGRQEIIRWTAPDGLAVEGLLVYPADYEQRQRYPLLVNLGGDRWNRVRNVLDQAGAYQLFAAEGYAVLAPNPRGSPGYGEDFATARRRDLAGGELIDLMAGIDHLIATGVADPTRIAIYGSGYGAYLTSWTVAQTPRFKAAIALFGGLSPPTQTTGPSLTTEESLRAEGWIEMGQEALPLRLIRSVQTPLLIVQRGESPTTLVSQSGQLYRALRDLRRQVEYVELPRFQPHELSDLFFRQLRWFDRYLKFGGADLFEFYLVEESVPGPHGWEMRVLRAEPRADISGVAPGSGRYLEVALSFRPDEAALRARTVRSFQLDPLGDVRLLTPGDTIRAPAGTITEIFGRDALASEAISTISVTQPQAGASTALSLRLAFEIREESAEYRLEVEGFQPVRIWVAGGN
ncbi:MAG: S9 family peptidase [Gemmatimonadota bacterium]|nr:MAG: S9 family peptidase [Gemmatimonadota bacterium]